MTWNGLKVGATLVFGATLLSGCSSSGAEVPPSATLTVLDSTAEAQAAEADDISLSDLLAAPVPVACEHPAGPLVDGYLPGIDPHDGYVSIFGQDASGAYNIRATTSALTGGQSPESLVVLNCSQGGVGWPQLLVLYGPGPSVVDDLDLGETSGGVEHATVLSMEPDADAVNVTWYSTNGCCFDAKQWTGTLRYQDSQLVMEDVSYTPQPTPSP